MKISLSIILSNIKIDRSKRPLWASYVKRWHQLDDESYAVAEATSINIEKISSPDCVVIVSPEGSLNTDFKFSHNDSISPSMFVHTLPNVRSLSYGLIANWEGPVFCLTQGEHSLVTALDQFGKMMRSGRNDNILFISVNKQDTTYFCDFYFLRPGAPINQWYLLADTITATYKNTTDASLRHFMENRAEHTNELQLTKSTVIGRIS